MGEFENGVSEPSGLIVNSEIELSSLFAVYRNPPPGAIVSPYGPLPVTKGEPGTGTLLICP